MRKFLVLFFIIFSITAFAEQTTPTPTLETLIAQTNALEQEIKVLKTQLANLTPSMQVVINSPYLGKESAFNGSDLITNISDVNLDTSLMTQRNTLENLRKKSAAANQPIIMLSGMVQPIALDRLYSNGGSSGTLALYTTELDSAVILNAWVEGFFSLAAGASAYTSSQIDNPIKISNDLNLTVDNAFVNIGNFDKTPFYTTLGQAYLSFGQYQTNMVTSPMITSIGEVRIPTAMLGYTTGTNNGLSGKLFFYRSNVTLGKTDAGGGSLTYQFGNDSISGNISSSIISNIADAGGMQNTNGTNGEFTGFGFNANSEAIGQTPGYDFNGVINIGAYSLLAEYVSAMYPFDPAALSYNNQGAQPMGGNIELARTLTYWNKPITFAVGYGWTEQALALDLAAQRFSALINISWWRDTVESLEFRHDIDYGASDTANGIGGTVLTTGSNISQNTITASLSVYF